MKNLAELLNERRPLIMGILNVTPDSFSDGGEYYPVNDALKRATQMIGERADIIDVGGVSTRPPGSAYGEGAQPVSRQIEIDRIIPVIRTIRLKHPEILLSIDTTNAETAELALDAGADIINDVSAGTVDSSILGLAARRDVPLILMHGYGPEFQEASIDEYCYLSVVQEVMAFLERKIERAKSEGVRFVLADIGFGFAKGYRDNMRLLNSHREFSKLGVPLVLGVSRKTSIGKAQRDDAPPKGRLIGSIVAQCHGVRNGAHIIRTHDVRETFEALATLESIESDGTNSQN